MSTGDINNNIRKLVSELKQVSYDIGIIDFDALAHGIPSAFLPIVHHVFLDYSHELASYLAKKNYDLYGRTDLRFVETVFKILMQEFSYKPNLKKEQFLALGFAERKIILLKEIVRLCREKKKTICIKKKQRISSARSITDSKVTGTKCVSDFNTDELLGERKDIVLSRKEAEGTEDETFRPLQQEQIKDNAAVSASQLSSGKENDVPIPHPRPLPWSNGSILQDKIPKPCDSLVITPLKETGRLPQECSSIESLPRKSRADIVEIEDMEEREFTVVSHQRDGSLGAGKQIFANETIGDNSYTQSRIEDSQISQMNTNDVIDMQKDVMKAAPGYFCPCNNNCNESLIRSLQDNVLSLSASLKDVVGINNDLSARIVLLETQHKLMEGKLEGMTSELRKREENDSEDSEYNVATSFQSRSKNKDLKKNIHDYAERSKETDEYSPEKYRDADEYLPAGFRPISISIGAEHGFSSHQPARMSLESDNNDIDDAHELPTPLQKSSYSGEVESSQQILSPLRGTKFSFMEENTKTTVLNLQKRLEETMNLFKMSTKTTKLENDSQQLEA